MRCPTLSELPQPPSGRTGWPWTEENPQLPETIPDCRPWPQVSIVTPSYNQGQFLEETIRSVLLQGYPDLEYIIIDGGSTDGSMEVISKYEPWLAYWVSEPDRGQSHAINKGWGLATGDILAWLNSDDTYQPEAIYLAVRALIQHPDAALVYGHYNCVDENSHVIQTVQSPPFDARRLLAVDFIPQQTVFIRSGALHQVGLLNESYQCVMDYDLWLRMARLFPFTKVDAVLANFRLHAQSKTVFSRLRCLEEKLRMFDVFFADPTLPAELQAEEGRARFTVYNSLAYAHYARGKMEETRKAIAQARATGEAPLGLHILWLKTWLGPNLRQQLRRAKKRLLFLKP
jgi:glycosyltransferase involved in cell wall biosynthesis